MPVSVASWVAPAIRPELERSVMAVRSLLLVADSLTVPHARVGAMRVMVVTTLAEQELLVFTALVAVMEQAAMKRSACHGHTLCEDMFVKHVGCFFLRVPRRLEPIRTGADSLLHVRTKHS